MAGQYRGRALPTLTIEPGVYRAPSARCNEGRNENAPLGGGAQLP